MSPSTALQQIREDSVLACSTITKREREFADVDAVLFAVGGAAENKLWRAFIGWLPLLPFGQWTRRTWTINGGMRWQSHELFTRPSPAALSTLAGSSMTVSPAKPANEASSV